MVYFCPKMCYTIFVSTGWAAPGKPDPRPANWPRIPQKTIEIAGVFPRNGDTGPEIRKLVACVVMPILGFRTERSIYLAEKLKIIPLGGLDEIGKNITVLEYGKDMIVVDCGVGFPTRKCTALTW